MLATAGMEMRTIGEESGGRFLKCRGKGNFSLSFVLWRLLLPMGMFLKWELEVAR